MRELVCDTSALVSLHQIGQLDLLPALAATVLVPSAVERELAAGRSAGCSVPDIAALAWIVICAPTRRPVLPDARYLGEGESEVLWVTLETPGAVAVLDEGPARRASAQLGIPFTGTLGLLLDAKQRGLTPAVAPLLNELHRHGFRMSGRVREAVLKSAGETP